MLWIGWIHSCGQVLSYWWFYLIRNMWRLWLQLGYFTKAGWCANSSAWNLDTPSSPELFFLHEKLRYCRKWAILLAYNLPGKLAIHAIDSFKYNDRRIPAKEMSYVGTNIASITQFFNSSSEPANSDYVILISESINLNRDPTAIFQPD